MHSKKNTVKKILLLTIPALIFVLMFMELILFKHIIPSAAMPFAYFDKQFGIFKYDIKGPVNGMYTHLSLSV
jgi:hypothetical protein